jgi:hypothetical protein
VNLDSCVVGLLLFCNRFVVCVGFPLCNGSCKVVDDGGCLSKEACVTSSIRGRLGGCDVYMVDIASLLILSRGCARESS